MNDPYINLNGDENICMNVYTCNKEYIGRTQKMDKCIILDLDETLVHTFDESSKNTFFEILYDPDLSVYKKRLYYTNEVNNEHLYGIMRQDLHNFLYYCFSNFRLVAVWTAGISSYADAIVKIITNDLQSIKVVYSRNQCVNENGKLIKPLSFMVDNPKLFGIIRPENVIMLDDKSSIAKYNIENLIKVPKFNPKTVDEAIASDDCFIKLTKFFTSETFKKSKDVRSLNTSNIFN